MRDLIKKILKESEDDLQWALDITDSVVDLPPYDGNRYVIRFKQNTPRETFAILFKQLVTLGWQPLIDTTYNVNSITVYSEDSGETYVHLKPDGEVGYGSDKGIFENVNGISIDEVTNIWYN